MKTPNELLTVVNLENNLLDLEAMHLPSEIYAVSMQHKEVVLRSLRVEDYPFLFRLRTDMDSLHLWEGSHHVPTQKEYYQELDFLQRSHIDTFLVVAAPNDQRPVGMSFTFNTDLVDGFTFGAITLASEFRRKNVGTTVTLLFLRYAFTHLPLRKVYADVAAYNIASLALVRKVGFVEEGCFRDHRYYAGKYWDSYRLAFYREDLGKIDAMLTQV